MADKKRGNPPRPSFDSGTPRPKRPGRPPFNQTKNDNKNVGANSEGSRPQRTKQRSAHPKKVVEKPRYDESVLKEARKDNSQNENKSKRRPGRPPLPKSDKVDETPKRRPGRPPKPKSEEELNKPKRRPGRPPKPKSEEELNKPKRRPGRPPKPKSEEELNKPKRRPGRPPKPKTEAELNRPKRRPGRPKLSESDRKSAPIRSASSSGVNTHNIPTAVVDNTSYNNTPSDLRNGRLRTEKSTEEIVNIEFKGEKVEVELYSEFNMDGFSKDEIKELFKLQMMGRRLDEKAALYLKMAKGWSYHAPVAGHDGIQIAMGKSFREKKDFLFPYYRDFLTALAAGMTPEEIILNGLSKATDVTGGGRHMSNHFGKPEWNIANVSSCTGNHSQHAAGMARAIKKFNGDEIVYYSGGDSAVAEGYFYEAVAAADLDKSPCIFVLQNNFFGISVPLDEVTNNVIVSDTFLGFKNLKIIECDGRDVFASMRAIKDAQEYVQSGKGPAMIHAECDRLGSHSNSDRHEGYRSEDEMKVMGRRDPLNQFKYHLINNGIMSQKEIDDLEEQTKIDIFAAADKAEPAPDPDGKDWQDFLYHEPAYKPEDNTEVEIPSHAKQVSLLEGINIALKQEFRANPHTYLWGQDIGKGGVFNVVKGMPEEFGKERVFNAPISENQIVGTANGFSRYRDDIRVVVEGAEFADYFWPAMEQYVELAHEYWRTKGQSIPNVTLRLASGGYIQGGLYHSQTIEAALAHIPGVRIVYPAFADDAIGLMRNCIRSKGPTMFLEPKFAYNFKPAFGPVPPDNFVIPFGKLKERRAGQDVTVVTYGNAVHMSNFAADKLEKEGISVQILDLRSIIPWDKEGVLEAVKKTNRIVVVTEDRIQAGFGGDIASFVAKEAFNYLDAPVNRVGSKDVHVGFHKAYETESLIQIDDVVKGIKETVNY